MAAESSLDTPCRPQVRQHAASEPIKSSFNPFARPGGNSKPFPPGYPLSGVSSSHPIEIADCDEPDYTPTRPGPRRKTAQPYPVRPVNESRVQSEPVPGSQNPRQERGPVAQDPRDIDNNIRHRLISDSPLKRAKNGEEKRGVVYMMPFYYNDKRVLKIGFTTKIRKADRAKDIERGCKGLERDSKGQYCTERILRFEKLEKLVLAELRPWRDSFVCDCGKQHTEFFDVDEALARQVIDRWEKFCGKAAFNSKGSLTSFWKYAIYDITVCGSTVLGCANTTTRYWLGRQPPCPQSETFEDHEARHERWETFINVDTHYHMLFDIGNFFMHIWDWRRELLIWGQGAVICCLLYFNFYNALAVFYGVGVFFLGYKRDEPLSSALSHLWSKWWQTKAVPNSPRSSAKGSAARAGAGPNLTRRMTPSLMGGWIEDSESEPESSDEGDEMD